MHEANTSMTREKYKNPRVLSCLHVLCENCLKELLTNEDDDACENALFSGRGKPLSIITCPLCKQDTMVTNAPCNTDAKEIQ